MSFTTQTMSYAKCVGQGGEQQTSAAAPTIITPSLHTVLPSTPTFCSQCNQQVVAAPPGLEYYSPIPMGQLSWLPKKHTIDPSSMVHRPDSEVNDGAGNHPCLVAMVSQCAHLVFCMPMTSFANGGIEQKFSRAHNPHEMYEEYMPLAEATTPPTHSKGALPYAGPRMSRQSYVHLEFGYWIEWAHLTGRNMGRLTFEALATVRQAYCDHEMDRQKNGSKAKARMERSRSNSLSSTPSPPPTPSATPFKAWGSAVPAPPTPPPSPPQFVLAPQGNTAIPIRKSASREKMEAMNGSWR